MSQAELAQITAAPPFAIKPAIKEHFFYATKAKAWRADDAAQLLTLFEKALALVGPGEVMVQELVPGDGRRQYAYCALYEKGAPLATMVCGGLRRHPPEFDRQHVRRDGRERSRRRAVGAAAAPDRLRRPGRAGVQARRARRPLQAARLRRRTWGYHSIAQKAGVDFPYLAYRRQLGLPVEPRRARAGVRWVRLPPTFPPRRSRSPGGVSARGPTCARYGAPTSRPCSAVATRCRGWPSSRWFRTCPSRGGSEWSSRR